MTDTTRLTEAARLRLTELEAFLDGSGTLMGYGFGEHRLPGKGQFWWRKHMHDVFAEVRSALSASVAAPTEAAAPAERTTERHIALREGHEIASEDDYFNARPKHDTEDRRHYFREGFTRGFDAGEKVYASPAPAQAEPKETR